MNISLFLSLFLQPVITRSTRNGRIIALGSLFAAASVRLIFISTVFMCSFSLFSHPSVISCFTSKPVTSDISFYGARRSIHEVHGKTMVFNLLTLCARLLNHYY